MKLLQTKSVLLLSLVMLSQHLYAADVVPFSIKRIKPVGAGYLELVGPGEIRVGKEVKPFEKTKYIRKTNIGTMTSVDGSDKGCVMSYSSEGYTEAILVRKQSCNEILSILSVLK